MNNIYININILIYIYIYICLHMSIFFLELMKILNDKLNLF